MKLPKDIPGKVLCLRMVFQFGKHISLSLSLSPKKAVPSVSTRVQMV